MKRSQSSERTTYTDSGYINLSMVTAGFEPAISELEAQGLCLSAYPLDDVTEVGTRGFEPRISTSEAWRLVSIRLCARNSPL